MNRQRLDHLLASAVITLMVVMWTPGTVSADPVAARIGRELLLIEHRKSNVNWHLLDLDSLQTTPLPGGYVRKTTGLHLVKVANRQAHALNWTVRASRAVSWQGGFL